MLLLLLGIVVEGSRVVVRIGHSSKWCCVLEKINTFLIYFLTNNPLLNPT